MSTARRMGVVFALAGYLLATTAVHFLHDHSAGDPHGSRAAACDLAARHEHAAGRHAHPHGPHQHARHQHGRHVQGPAQIASADERSSGCGDLPGSDCEDHCLACRFLAVKSIPCAPVALADRVETLRPIESREPALVSVDRPSLPFSRGPPSA